MNRRQWPIPVLDYSTTSTFYNSSVIGVTTTGTIGQDQVTFATTIEAILKPGDKVVIDGVNYEIKYIKGNGQGTTSGNEVVLTSLLLTGPSGNLTKKRFKYDVVTIEFNDAINTPTGVVAVANKSVSIAVPSITEGNAYSSTSQAATDLLAILNVWMPSTPRNFATLSV